MSNYTHIQFINHIFETTPAKGSILGKETYLGITPIKDDIAARVDFVSQVIQKAKANAKVKQKDATVLKVFMMPEFAFRGPTGAYTMEEGINLVESLQKLVRGKDWQDWLFVFGTVVCKSYVAKKTKPGKWAKLTGSSDDESYKKYTAIDPDAKVEIYNIAPIQKGGFQASPAHQFAHSVMKRYKSELDFIKEENLKGRVGKKLVDEKVEPLETVPVPEDFSKFVSPKDKVLSDEELLELKYSYIYGDSVFDQDDITFGLEICFDHSREQLKKLLEAAESALTEAEIEPKQIDVHLLTSCAIRSISNSIASREGYFVHCDGSAFGATETFSQVRRVQGRNTLHKTKYVPLTTPVKPLTNPALSVPSVRVVKPNNTKTVALNKLYPNGAGKLQISDALPLPPFQQDDLSQQKTLSQYFSTEFPTESDKTPVSINGMKTLFDKAVPVSPVQLIPKNVRRD